MKKLFFIIAITFLFLFSHPVYSAFAQLKNGDYARIITSDTPFFKDSTDTEPLFYLPYTYYVKVLSFGESLCFVECFGENGFLPLDGFVPTDLLYDDQLTVSSPYPIVKLKTQENSVLYADTKLSIPIQHIFADREMFYYGESVAISGEKLYYVSYNNRLGYVKESQIIPFTITNHQNPLTFIPTDSEDVSPHTDENSGDNNQAVKIIIFISLGLAGIIALFLAFKSKRENPVAVGYYEENDYE